MLNETMDEPTSTNTPTSWRPYIAETPSTISDLFTVLKMDLRHEKSVKIKVLAS
jgi:hypothetical protein